jgi:hypothetical protein
VSNRLGDVALVASCRSSGLGGRAVPEGSASPRGDRRQPHGSLLTRRWREMGSDLRFLVARPSNRYGRGDCCLENGSGSVREPKVRIHLPPAASPLRTCFLAREDTHWRQPDAVERPPGADAPFQRTADTNVDLRSRGETADWAAAEPTGSREADASRIEEHHLPDRRGGQMPAALWQTMGGPPQSCRPLCGAEPSLSRRLAVVTGFPRRSSCHGSAFEAHGVPGLRATRLPAYRSRS